MIHLNAPEQAPEPAPHPHPVLPAELAPGDMLRDLGRLRTVAHVSDGGAIADLLIVHFEYEPVDGDDKHPHLGIPAHQPVTVWRTAPTEEES